MPSACRHLVKKVQASALVRVIECRTRSRDKRSFNQLQILWTMDPAQGSRSGAFSALLRTCPTRKSHCPQCRATPFVAMIVTQLRPWSCHSLPVLPVPQIWRRTNLCRRLRHPGRAVGANANICDPTWDKRSIIKDKDEPKFARVQCKLDQPHPVKGDELRRLVTLCKDSALRRRSRGGTG